MKSAWREAQKHLAGGVNSPVRAFKAVGRTPIFMKRAKNAYLYDRNGKAYIDYCLSWGAILLGHSHPETVKAIQKQAEMGTSFGTVTEYETILAKEIKKAFPSLERLRFTSSGTEAVMSAIRLARGVTKRKRILKFEGCYHGHSDSLLVQAGSGLATFGKPNSEGVPPELASLTSVLPYNDSNAVIDFFKKNRDLACVIIEPIAANMGVVPAKEEFLHTLSRESKKTGALLIFDEVVTGFRVGYGGAQHLLGIHPDITILGKIIGGGLPIGAFGAKKEIMDALSPTGGVYQAGTLSGNPLSMAAGRATLSKLSKTFYEELNRKAGYFLTEARAIFRKKGRLMTIQNIGSMFTIFFSGKSIDNLSEAARQDKKAFCKFFYKMLGAGIYIPPSTYEASFLSMAHGPKELEQTLKVFRKS